MAYKTPGVYVEEISKFPPSVAQVETAIPAFIGYTEIAKEKVDGDLKMKPKRITSMLEYETYFGFPANEQGITVDVSADGTIVVNGPTQAGRSKFIMYYCMQMYFANGGGPCWITSVGQYEGSSPATAVVFNDLKDGLDEIKKQDEPTLILFPDATFMTPQSDFYNIYQLAMDQCALLKDRFTILDTYTDAVSSIDALRQGITNNLKYGGAYFPNLQTILDYRYLDSEVLVTDPNAPTYSAQITTLSNSINVSPLQTLITQLQTLQSQISGSPTLIALRDDIIAKSEEILDFMSGVEAKAQAASSIADEALTESGLSPSDPDYSALNSAKDDLDDKIAEYLSDPATIVEGLLVTLATLTTETSISDNVDDIFTALGLDTPPSVTTNITDMKSTELDAVITASVPFSNGNAYLDSYELNNNVLYNRIKAEISAVPVILPPSSSMAGVYARVDSTVGVWKAPANIGLNYVIAPTVLIDNEMQADMNVTSTGKSVNAIRSFTGKGTLVWGARTLMGNDNEWRYISVRRFFNMVEESVSEASEQFVFEANDANTWVRIRAMIENFLNLQWKAGALTGAKPEQAYYVRVGLGQTMTAQDILEGNMIIEIGMAVVRPAEFIVLRFSHKMQEA